MSIKFPKKNEFFSHQNLIEIFPQKVFSISSNFFVANDPVNQACENQLHKIKLLGLIMQFTLIEFEMVLIHCKPLRRSKIEVLFSFHHRILFDNLSRELFF